MYGINRHNGSLIIFDRFSMENANTVVFAKSGAGKSYFVKLEALRSLVFGTEIMIIDVEEEYKILCEAVGGDFISFSSNSSSKINPFDLSGIVVEGENELGQKVLSLHTLFKLMLGELSPTEEAILDKALMETYRIKGITTDPITQKMKEPPVMEDLYKVLLGADEPEAKGMAERLEKYIKGSLAGIFDAQSTINLSSKMTVFCTKNLEDILKPVAFYIILDFVWTRIRRDLKKRILIVEEAWNLLQREDSARFIYGVAKRARKYYLGLTTISQDVDDFLGSEYGKAIVTNSSIQVLLKQHPAAIDKVAETFNLSEGEKRLLLAADKGEGLFFAGNNHVAMKVKASDEEDKLITTNPAELLKLREEGLIKAPKPQTPQVPQMPPVSMPQSQPVQPRPQPQPQPAYQAPAQAQPNVVSTPQPRPQQPFVAPAPVQNNPQPQSQPVVASSVSQPQQSQQSQPRVLPPVNTFNTLNTTTPPQTPSPAPMSFAAQMQIQNQARAQVISQPQPVAQPQAPSQPTTQQPFVSPIQSQPISQPKPQTQPVPPVSTTTPVTSSTPQPQQSQPQSLVGGSFVSRWMSQNPSTPSTPSSQPQSGAQASTQPKLTPPTSPATNTPQNNPNKPNSEGTISLGNNQAQGDISDLR
jgi:hypothetical protein